MKAQTLDQNYQQATIIERYELNRLQSWRERDIKAKIQLIVGSLVLSSPYWLSLFSYSFEEINDIFSPELSSFPVWVRIFLPPRASLGMMMLTGGLIDTAESFLVSHSFSEKFDPSRVIWGMIVRVAERFKAAKNSLEFNNFFYSFSEKFSEKFDPLRELTVSECQEEIKDLKEHTSSKNIATTIIKSLIGNERTGKRYWMLVSGLSLFSEVMTPQLETWVPVCILSPITSLLALSAHINDSLQTNICCQKLRISYCRPIIDKFNSVLHDLNLKDKIELSFLEKSIDEETETDSLWYNQFRSFISEENVIICNKKINKVKDDKLCFYIMLNLSFLLDNFFGLETLVLSKDGLVIKCETSEANVDNYDKLLDLIFKWKKSQPISEKEIKLFGEKATVRLSELLICNNNLNKLKSFLIFLFKDLILPDSEEIIYQNESDTLTELPGFDVSIRLSDKGKKWSHYSDLKNRLKKFEISHQGFYYYLLDGKLHLKNCNQIIISLTRDNVKQLINAEKNPSPTQTKPLLQQEVKQSLSDTEEKKKPRDSRLIDHKVISFGGAPRSARLFVPTVPVTIEKIEWKYHVSGTPIYPLRRSNGQIQDFALLLSQGNLDAKISDMLKYSSIIYTRKARGNHIRRLTDGEKRDLMRRKPRLFNDAAAIYNKHFRLDLAYKICLAGQQGDTRIYGFRFLDEVATIFYNNHTDLKHPQMLVVFCVTDDRAHKARRGSGIFPHVDSDPYLKFPSPEKFTSTERQSFS